MRDRCTTEACEAHYACRLRAKGLHISSAATPNRVANMTRRVAPRRADPAWERGTVGERRVDGSTMPYLSPTSGRPMRVKEFAEGRSGFEAQIKSLKSNPTVFTKE